MLVTNTNRLFYKTMASQQDLMNPEAIDDPMLAYYKAKLPATVQIAVLGGGSAAGISRGTDGSRVVHYSARSYYFENSANGKSFIIL